MKRRCVTLLRTCLLTGALLAAAQAQTLAPLPVPPAPPAPPPPPAAPSPPAAPAPLAPLSPGLEGRSYSPGAFDAIDIGGSADVRFTQGDSDQVFVEGDADTQKTVSLEVRGGVLRIRSQGAWKFWSPRRLQLQVVARSLARLAITGAADVHAPGPVQGSRLVVHISGAGLARFDQVNVDQLVFGVSGAGDCQVAGQARELQVSISGKSDFRGENLVSRRARISVSGIGDVKVWATDDLTISVAGIGSVDYWGTAAVRRSTSGLATINDRGAKPVPALLPNPPSNPPSTQLAPDARPAAVPTPTADPRPVSR